MFLCPACHKSLEYRAGAWECPDCRNQLVYFHQITGLTDPQKWLFQPNPTSGSEVCPSCFSPFQAISFQVQSRPITAKSCPVCRLLWISSSEHLLPQTQPLKPADPGFNPDTTASAPPLVAASNEPVLSAQERLAVMQAKMVATQFKRKYVPNRPEHWWEYILAFLGFPVQAKKTAIDFPWVTWIIIGITCLFSIMAWNMNFRHTVMTWGMVPARVKETFGMTLMTSFFLHGDITHLLGNMYFLGLFGGKAEYNLGRTNYLLLLLSATLIGNFTHLLFDPRSTVPAIGASGGISGVIVFYCFKFPKDKFYQLFYFRFVKISAWFYCAIWLVFQAIGAGQQIAGYSNVSSLAHLGGALVGLIYALTWHNKSGVTEEDPFGLD